MATVNVITTDTGKDGHGVAIGGEYQASSANAAVAGCSAVALGSGSLAGPAGVSVGFHAYNSGGVQGAAHGAVAIGDNATIGSSADRGAIAIGQLAAVNTGGGVAIGGGAQSYEGAVAIGPEVDGHNASSATNGLFIGGSSITFYIGGQRKTLSVTDFFAKLS